MVLFIFNAHPSNLFFLEKTKVSNVIVIIESYL